MWIKSLRWQRLIFILAFSLGMSSFTLADTDPNFITFADIHFDPFSSCRNKRPCPLIQKLRMEKAENWSTILTAAENTELIQYGEDTNYPLLKSALNAASQVAAGKKVKFILILGDFLGHDYKRNYKTYSGDKRASGYQSFVYKTFVFLNQQIAQSFPNIDVFSAIGNNDTYQHDYVVKPRGQFFQDLSKLWASVIKDAKSRENFQKDFPIGGYYAVTLPQQTNLRLIVLNSTLFSRNVRGKGVDIAAQDQLNWFHQQLLEARTKQQKVFIGMHIPEGIDVSASLRIRLLRLIELWKPMYLQYFHAQLKEFSPEISAIFTGHLHTDWLQMIRFGKLQEIASFGNPAISPIYGTVPGFKMYVYSSQTGLIKHFVLYYFSTKKRTWQEYDK